MEFSFEYIDVWRAINENRNMLYSFAFVGVVLLYLPIRLVVNILGQAPDGKLNVVAGFYILFTWLMGTIGLGVLSFAHPPGITIFLFWCSIALVNLSFAISNASIIYKYYNGVNQKYKKGS